MGIFDLTGYMNKSIEKLVKDASKSALLNPKLIFFFMKFIRRCKKAALTRRVFEEQGTHIPPFLIASITGKCNLFCKGCYARANNACSESNPNQLTSEKWKSIFHEAGKLGVSFILLAGGEPFMRRDVIETAAKQKNICFPIFTNGTMIDEAALKWMDKYRNLIPVVSIEGTKIQTDERRGKGVYQKVTDIMEKLSKLGIFYGASVTVTTANIEFVTDERFIKQLFDQGCKLIFYVEYVPVTIETKDLALSEIERRVLDEKLNQLRAMFDRMIFLSFPGDEKHTGGCLAAGRGFFHISVNGNAEPCPFSPYSDTNLNEKSLLEALGSPLFNRLLNTGMLNLEHTGGCVLFDKEKEVLALLKSDAPISM